MARLNYTARRITGIKAGQALKKDLNKRIPTTPNFKVRDPVMEIDISGKQLKDDGFNEFILELYLALESSSPEHPQGVNKMQELHLQGNLLTVNSLVELAKVIALSAQDLRELDLSNNNINILTDSDVKKWQYFLQSFSQCCVLKKVDFSNNILGARGIEVLARVYIRSDLDFVETDADTDTGLGAEHDRQGLTVQNGRRSSDNGVSAPSVYATVGTQSSSQATRSSQRRGTQATSASKILTEAELRHFSCTRGLRSVPYLVLQNVAMTNGGVIHLVEMFKAHRTPEHLLSFLPGGKALTLPDPENAFRGIYWLPNDDLSPLSAKLVRLTEQMHQSAAENEIEDEFTEDFQELGINNDSHGDLQRRKQRQKLNVELNRVTKLHRIHILGSEGLRKSEIWHGALRMLTVARALLLDDNSRPPSVEEEWEATRNLRPGSLESKADQSPVTPSPTVPGIHEDRVVPPGVLISSFRFDPESSTFDLMFPAIHRSPEYPIVQDGPPPVAAAMSTYPSPVTQPPQTPGFQQSKGKDKINIDDGNVSHSRIKVPVDNGAPLDQYRFGLPLHIWRRIISEAVGVQRILHPDQQMRILSYAASWSALAGEVSINGAPEHQRVWKILDSIDCFTYKPLAQFD